MNPEELHIRSFYLPKEGLQGQLVPVHVLWSGSDWDEVRIRISRRFRYQSVFNVRTWDRRKSVLRFKTYDFKVPGYVGIVLRSSVAKRELQYASRVEVTFRKGSSVLFKSTKEIGLFRPEIEIVEVPREIRIGPQGSTSGRLLLRYSGMGTLLLFAVSAPHSAIRTRIPDDVKLAYEEFAEEITKGFEIAAKEFPEHSKFFGKLLRFDPSKRDEFEKIRNLIEREIHSSRELKEVLIRIFSVAYSRTTRIQTAVVKPVLDISRSTLARGVLLANPFMELSIPSGRSDLRLVITGKNLLGQTISRAVTPSVGVIAEGAPVHLPLSSILGMLAPGESGVGP